MRRLSINAIIFAILALCELSNAHYSPELGSFLSRDPIEEEGGVNLYAFAERDPIGKWDKLGNAVMMIEGNTIVTNLVWSKKTQEFNTSLECYIKGCYCSYKAEISWSEASNGLTTFYTNISFNVTEKKSGNDARCVADILTSLGSISGTTAAGEHSSLETAPFINAANNTSGFEGNGSFSRVDMMNASELNGTLEEAYWMPGLPDSASGAMLRGIYISFKVDLTHPITCGSNIGANNTGTWKTELSKPN